MSALASSRSSAAASAVALPALLGISLVHLLNDSMQAVVPAMFPVLEKSLSLSLTQIGWISFTLNMTSSVLQPAVGTYTDRRSSPYLMAGGMALSLIGMVGIALAPAFWGVLAAVLLIGFGSAIFHPEGSRVVYFAAGGRRGFAQSVYQVGGNAGSSLAPLMTMAIFIPLGQVGAIWATAYAALAIAVLLWLAPWYKAQLTAFAARASEAVARGRSAVAAELQSHPHLKFAMGLLVFIVFARSWYHAGISSFYQFYLIRDYGLTEGEAQIPIFLFLFAGVLGTFFGGVTADRIGLKRMIVLSVAGAIPFSLMLPHLPLFWVYPVIFILGFILLSGFSVSVVYAQQLMPSKVGLASGLTTGLAFGMGAIGAVVLGKLSDLLGVSAVMLDISFLPVVGLLALLLPADRQIRARG